MALLDKEVKRYVLLVRDPRDVLVSVYHQIRLRPNTSFLQRNNLNHRLPWTPLPASVRELNTKNLYDILISEMLPELSRFVDRWIEHCKNNGNVFFVRMEDLTKNPGAEIRKILLFFEINKSESEILSIVNSLPITKWNLRRGARLPSVTGSWREELTLEQQIRSERIVRSALEKANYPFYFD